MIKPVFIFIICLIGLSALQSCYYDNEEELYGAAVDCGLGNLSYTEDIVPILDRFCYECHDDFNQLGGITLEGHSNVIPHVESQALLGSIKHDPGYSAMPDNAPKMDFCRIEAIEIWIAEGALDN